MPTITRSAARQAFLADILTTAVEGGINYWSQVAAYRWQSPDLGYSDGREGAPEVADAEVTIVETEDQAQPRHAVTLDDVARGLALIREAKRDENASRWYVGTTIKHLSDGVRVKIAKADREMDAGWIDSDLADVIVQVALFNEVVYG